MHSDLDTLLAHYSTVTDGSSALFKESFDALCLKHGVSSANLCYAFARKIAERFVAGTIDFDTGDFAINDLFWASGCSLNGFALEVFYAFEDGEVLEPRYPPGTVPWKEYTLPGVREALARDDELRTA
ncbi:hypothetical protein [Luteimonas sp. A501]